MPALSQEDINALQSIFSRVGVAFWVNTIPFSSLTFRDSVSLHNGLVNGWYDYQTGEASIATSRHDHEFNQTLIWGNVEALSYTGRTLQEATQFTLLHELGHHVHAKLRDSDLALFGQTMRVVRSDAVSNYAKTDRIIEYFAETFVAWALYRVELLVHDQLGYGMRNRALDALGVEVREYDFDQKTTDAS